MDLMDFRRAAETLQGSADLGAQLLCCLLRAVGVEARLVFSLQPLSFTAASEAPSLPKPAAGKKTLYVVSTDDESDREQKGDSNTAVAPTTEADDRSHISPPQRIRRMGQSRAGVNTPIDMGKPPPGLTLNRSQKVSRPSHPVFWVEAFNPAFQKWVAVDAVATKTIAKPSRIEPALNDQKNILTYAVAFEEDGSAKDVTRRYAKAYNAKTRRWRVECTPAGDKWFKKAMKLFKRYAVLVCKRLLMRDR
jgi:xeroderma pigmentosum group C-complementing protein